VILRAARWAWPIIFFLPLTLVAQRGCEFPGVDPAYHSVMWLHENLPVLFLIAGIISAVVVMVRVARARAKVATLFSLSTPLPASLLEIFAQEAARLNIRVPAVAYLDVAAPLCFAIVGLRPAVVLSRGFIEDLPEGDVHLVVRHELLHVKHRDPARGFAWHIAFAALLLPAFSELERWLAARRELRTNLAASADNPDRYAALLRSRARNSHGLCAEGFGRADVPRNLANAIAQPLIVVMVLVALAYSHAWFLNHLAFLSSHHC
jgi:Zn-dependent protease with chaperone function